MFDFHPLITSFPVTLIFLAILAEAIYVFNKGNFWLKLNNLALALGGLFSLLAFITGLLASTNLGSESGQIEDLIGTHYAWAKLILFIYIPLILFSYLRFDKKVFNILYFMFLLIQVTLIAYTSHLGGDLVFQHGIGVAR